MRNKIMTVLLLAAMVVVLTGLTGCKSEHVYGMSGTGLTKHEVNQQHFKAIQNNLWQLQDDIDAFFLIDRPSRMNRLTVR